MPKIFKATKRTDTFAVSAPMPGQKFHNRTIVLEQGVNVVSEEDLEALRAHPLWKPFCASNGVEVQGEEKAKKDFVAEVAKKDVFGETEASEQSAEASTEAADAEEPAEEIVKSERQKLIEELTALNVEFNEEAGVKKLRDLLKKHKK